MKAVKTCCIATFVIQFAGLFYIYYHYSPANNLLLLITDKFLPAWMLLLMLLTWLIFYKTSVKTKVNDMIGLAVILAISMATVVLTALFLFGF